MIIGKLTDLLDKELSNQHLQKGFQFLNETNFDEFAAGVHKESDELFFVINEYQTKGIEQGFWEAHRKYLDFHYILQGTERIAVDHIDNQIVIEDYHELNDVILFDGEIRSFVTMNPGDVMVCYPEDSHMTGIQAQKTEQVRKIVLKVLI